MLHTKLLALEQIKRWNHHPSIRTQNVAAHGYNVTVITAILARAVLKLPGEESARLVEQALWHDFTESVTGDVSPLVKRYANWDGVEKRACKEAANISEFPIKFHLDSDMDSLVKLADYLDAWLFARTECDLGNDRMYTGILAELSGKIIRLIDEVSETMGNLTPLEFHAAIRGLFGCNFLAIAVRDVPKEMSHV